MTKDDILRMAREAGIDAWWESGNECREDLQEHLEHFAGLVAATERTACARRFRPEIHRMWVNYERAVKILASIHALLYPPVVTDANGQTWKFKSPFSEGQMQELSDRIRAIPDELAALDADADADARARSTKTRERDQETNCEH